MRIEKCYFCSANCYPGHGMAFARNDAKVSFILHNYLTILLQLFRFCSSKCNKLFKAKKNPRKLKWTKAYRAAHGKEMTCDSVLDFEQRRNVPIRYNRDLMVQTLRAMKRVDEIKGARQERMFKQRMEAHKGLKRRQMEIELMKHVDLIEDPKIKEFIMAKKKIRQHAKEQNAIKNSKKTGIRAKMAIDHEMEIEDSDENEKQVVQQKALAKVSKKKISKRK